MAISDGWDQKLGSRHNGVPLKVVLVGRVPLVFAYVGSVRQLIVSELLTNLSQRLAVFFAGLDEAGVVANNEVVLGRDLAQVMPGLVVGTVENELDGSQQADT